VNRDAGLEARPAGESIPVAVDTDFMDSL